MYFNIFNVYNVVQHLKFMALDFLQNPDNFDCQKCQKVKYKSTCDIHPMKCEERARERENYYVIIHFLQNSNDDILPWHL